MGEKLIDLHYCNECKSLVNISHRCEQWSHVTTIPATAIRLIIANHKPKHETVEIMGNRESDPTLWHCKHKIADLNGYPYCPECGKPK